MSTSVSRAELEAIANQWISLWCVPVDWKLFDRLHAGTFEDCSAAGRVPTKHGFADGLRELVHAFPDLQTHVEQLVVDMKASQAAVRWSARGTNREAFLGIGPTGRLTPITGIEIIEVNHGQIIRRWGEWDISAHTAGIDPRE
ncbi:MAG: ester cyclase [Gammaproteobacteria bacterium]